MIREKRTVNCWLLTKSKRKKGKERRKRKKRKGGKEEEKKRGRRKEKKKKKEREEEDEKRERKRKKERRRKRRKHEKKIKATAKGNLQKTLQLLILPIELITAFFNFQKLISSGSASKQNYMMHTGHSCNFIGPFRGITSLSEALQAISEAYFSETQPQWNKKRSLPPPIAEAHLASSSFKNYFQTRRFSSPILT